MTRSLTGLAGTLRASRDRRNRLAGERAARLVADGAARDDNSDDSCSLNHDRYNAEKALNSLLARRRPGRAASGRVHARANRLTGGSLKTPIPPRDKRRTGRAPHDSAVGTKGAQS
jgi:hypothetical protein